MSRSMNVIISIIMASLLLACGGGGSGGTRNVGPVVTINEPGLIEERAAVELSVIATDSDGSIREIRWSQFSGPSISFTAKGDTITFTAPEVDADTAFSFQISAVDNHGAITTVDLNSTIINVNRAPEVSDVTLTVEQNSAIDFNLSAFDPDGDPLSFAILVQPLTGALELIDSATNLYRYTPDTDSLADDQITFEVSDSDLSAQALVIFDLVGSTRSKVLMISEVSSSQHLDDNRWIELYNGTDEAINLAEYSIKTDTISVADYSYSGTNTFSLPDRTILSKSYVVIQNRFASELWYLNVEKSDQLVVVGNINDDIRPMWNSSGFIELLDKNQVDTIDFIRFGMSHQLPVTANHWQSVPTVLDIEQHGKNLVRDTESIDSNSILDWYYVNTKTPASANPVNCNTSDINIEACWLERNVQ